VGDGIEQAALSGSRNIPESDTENLPGDGASQVVAHPTRDPQSEKRCAKAQDDTKENQTGNQAAENDGPVVRLD
jgi:hypothetical protein